MNVKSTNVVDIQTGEPIDSIDGISATVNDQTGNNVNSPEEGVCDAVKQYRIEKEVEERRREAGWPEAIGFGALLNLLGIF